MTGFFQKIVAFFTMIFAFLFPWLNQNPEKVYENTEIWSAQQAFTPDYVLSIEKTGEEFVILNLTDIQMNNLEFAAITKDVAYKEMDALVERVQPDLITLTGDNAFCQAAYEDIVAKMDSYGIPWAPILGNHAGDSVKDKDRYSAAYLLAHGENSLFRYGPQDMGYGNYAINITEQGKAIHTLVMTDTHSKAEFQTGNKKVSGYDHLWENQIEWYRWLIQGIEKTEGRKVPSTVFMHAPVCEYADAWQAAYSAKQGEYIDEYKETSFGENREKTCCPPVNNGFFTVCQELSSTKDMICGHDHANNASIVYQGIRLTYAMKTGRTCYWKRNTTGGTVIRIAADGSTNVEHIYS